MKLEAYWTTSPPLPSCQDYSSQLGARKTNDHRLPDALMADAFDIQFSPSARRHLQPLRKRDQQIILDTTERQLRHQPDVPSRNRKRLAENPLAPWELRVGDFRVFYDVDREALVVVILAVGKKTHNTLRIGNEEVEL